MPAEALNPGSLLTMFKQYIEPVLWRGFKSETQATGSNGLVATPGGLRSFAACMERLKLWHIDQTYKSMRSCVFGLHTEPHLFRCLGTSHRLLL